MLHLYDRATMAHALSLDLEPHLHRLLTERIAGLRTEYGDLTDFTEFLIVEPGDTENDILRHVGFSPLIEPFDGARYGTPAFHPHWDLLMDRGGWFEFVFTFGSTFAYIILVEDADGIPSELRELCFEHGDI